MVQAGKQINNNIKLTIMNRNLLFAVLAVIAIVIIVLIVPKGSVSTFFTAGGGVNLKELNQKDTTETSVCVTLQANQTTEANLEQALIAGSCYRYLNGFFIGGNVVAGASTQYGVCCPTMYFSTGIDFKHFQIEYRVGDFKRTSLMAPGVDPQYSNYCIDLGEGGSAGKAMQLSIVKGETRVGFGHQNGEDFYKLSKGSWYAYAESSVCRYLTLAGGVDLGNDITGYAAAKLTADHNCLVITGNKLGTENQNVIVTYNRNNIAVNGGKNTMIFSISGWAQKTAKGLHLTAGYNIKNATFFAELGSKYCADMLGAYCGVGTSWVF